MDTRLPAIIVLSCVSFDMTFSDRLFLLSRYQVDGNARVTTVDVTIGSKELSQLKLKYNQNIGTLESVSDLRIYKNTFNKTVIHDTAKQFFSISEYDNHGRLKSVMTNIKSMDVYRYVEGRIVNFENAYMMCTRDKITLCELFAEWNWSTT